MSSPPTLHPLTLKTLGLRTEGPETTEGGRVGWVVVAGEGSVYGESETGPRRRRGVFVRDE